MTLLTTKMWTVSLGLAVLMASSVSAGVILPTHVGDNDPFNEGWTVSCGDHPDAPPCGNPAFADNGFFKITLSGPGGYFGFNVGDLPTGGAYEFTANGFVEVLVGSARDEFGFSLATPDNSEAVALLFNNDGAGPSGVIKDGGSDATFNVGEPTGVHEYRILFENGVFSAFADDQFAFNMTPDASFADPNGLVGIRNFVITSASTASVHGWDLWQLEVPEPATSSLLGLGTMGLLLRRRRQATAG